LYNETHLAKNFSFRSGPETPSYTIRAEGRGVIRKPAREDAHPKENLAEIINVAIEELVRQRFELHGCTTIQKEAQRGRAEINRGLYALVYESLGDDGRQRIDQLWAEPGTEAWTTAWIPSTKTLAARR
jgi:hypothetical protein